MLLIFQAMDAAGKDGTIKHVMSGVNPQGCQVYSFKAPSPRSSTTTSSGATTRPARARPHRHLQPVVLRGGPRRARPPGDPRARSSPELVTKKIWERRYQDIRDFERYLARNGIVVRKFFLHVSREEQQRRFLERLDKPEKNWKFSAADAKEREHWDDYMEAYEEMIRQTATEHAPWYVVPADNKWFTRVVVAAAVIDALARLDLQYPVVDPAKLRELAAAKKALLAE